MKIGVIDSGIGGIKVLEHLQKNFGGNKYIYVFDKSGLPYGNKSEDEIKLRIINACNFLCKTQSVECIVIACNTGSCAALEECKKLFSIPIFGLIPPLKELSNSSYKSILLLTTVLTSQILSRKSANKTSNIIIAPQKNLASYIEQNSSSITALDLYIQNNLFTYKHKCDCVFLGCTHYYYIKDRLEKLLSLTVLDGRANLIEEMKKVIPPSDNVSSTEFYYL